MLNRVGLLCTRGVATDASRSAPGGKATRLAALTQHRGKVVAVERNAKRASQLRHTADLVGLLRRYLEAQEVDGRELLVFDSDEEVSSEVAARMLGVSRPFLNELLEVESIPYRRVGNQRRIRVLALHEYGERRRTAEAGLRQMADVVNESVGGWNQ